MRLRGILTALWMIVASSAASVAASVPFSQPAVSTRLAVLVAEDRRAPTPRDLAVIRAGLHVQDSETVRIAIRALGRLERAELVQELLPFLKSPLPEIRAEAANAIGQAAQGSKESHAMLGVDAAAMAAIARLVVETEPSVRAVLCQTIGRLPYATPQQVQRAELALVGALPHEESADGRLGVAQGLEALVRLHRGLSPPSARALAALQEFADTKAPRIIRIAMEALINADAVQPEVIARAAGDPDSQVRRLAMRAASRGNQAELISSAEVLKKGLTDPSAMVRIEALRGVQPEGEDLSEACAAVVAAVGDPDEHVSLLALDKLAACSSSADARAILERTVNDSSQDGLPRAWHRSAHALLALAAADPDRAKSLLPRFVGSGTWQLRLYAARAAAILPHRPALETLAGDDDDNVCAAAIAGLSKVAGGAANRIYIAALGRRGYQVIREAARAIASAPPALDDAAPILRAALHRLTAEGRDNSRDARIAIVDALNALGVRADKPALVRQMPVTSQLTADSLRRLASAKARVTIRGVGTFELALFTGQAPATVVRFVHLAESGYYNGLTFHRVVPNFVVQGGSPGANEYIGDASFMRDEVGLWPHVRGAVGISTRGRDTGDAQIFIDLVDNPRLDHEYTVFAQVLSGVEVVDAILEGDAIERVEIVP